MRNITSEIIDGKPTQVHTWERSMPIERLQKVHDFVDEANRQVCGAPDLGLSKVHISPQWFDRASRRPIDVCRAIMTKTAARAERRALAMRRITYSQGGTWVRLSTPGELVNGSSAIRGDITKFSAKSRRRLLDLLASIDVEATGEAIFTTMTYPGIGWPGNPADWKRHLDAWVKRMRRRYPDAWAVWKLEPQKRGAPHFHCLVFGIENMDHHWLAATWADVVQRGFNDLWIVNTSKGIGRVLGGVSRKLTDKARKDHRAAGTRVERCRSRNGVMWYAAKYVGKVDEAMPFGWHKVGRYWGVVNRAGMEPSRVIHSVRLHWRGWVRLKRIVRRWAESTGRRACEDHGTIKSWLPGGEFGRLLAWFLASGLTPRSVPGASCELREGWSVCRN